MAKEKGFVWEIFLMVFHAGVERVGRNMRGVSDIMSLWKPSWIPYLAEGWKPSWMARRDQISTVLTLLRRLKKEYDIEDDHLEGLYTILLDIAQFGYAGDDKA
jgi:hypothetical protein